MKCKVTHANGDGDAEQEYDSIQAAATALLAEFPDGVIYDAGGFDRDADDSDSTYDVRNGRIAMVWDSEEASLNDDGARSVAKIEEVK